jgi:protein TonB
MAAVLIALAVNAGLLFALSALNQTQPKRPEPTAQTTVRYQLQQPESPEQTPEPSQTPKPESTPQRKLEPTEVQPPEPEPVQAEPAPMPLDLPAARMAPVAIAQPPQPEATARRESPSDETKAEKTTTRQGQAEQSGITQRPRLIDKPQLRDARHGLFHERQGRVVIRFDIDAQGRVTGAELLRVEQGPEALGEALMEVVDRFRFEPARQDGEAVATTQAMRIRVELD